MTSATLRCRAGTSPRRAADIAVSAVRSSVVRIV